MNVLVLEHPRLPSVRHFNDIANTPLWSCLMGGYAAAQLQQGGHDVRYWDASLNEWDFDRTSEEILNKPADLICINTVYFWENTFRLFDFIDALRENGCEGHLNLFGFFPSLAWQAILQEMPAVDSIAVGECENTLAELANCLQRGIEKPVTEPIAGLAVRSSGGMPIFSFRAPEKDPDRFPFPLRLPDVGTTAGILASRGCYNHCSFCPIPTFYNQGPLWRGRTPRDIFEEIKSLVQQGITDFYFVDPNFVGPGRKGRHRILELMEQLRPLKITFGMETRPNDLDQELLESMVTAGFQSLLMGIESGSANILGKLNKNSSVPGKPGELSAEAESGHRAANIGERAITLCRDYGIEPEIGFLMFVPDSTLDDVKQNFAFLEHNQLLDRLERTANLLCHYQIVLSGPSGSEGFVAEGRLEPCGLLGFEGKITYRDPAVQWMAEVMIPICLAVLKEMAQPASPVNWEKSALSPAADRVNHFLVEQFRNLLNQAAMQKHLPPAAQIEKVIMYDLTALIDQSGNCQHP